MAPIPVLLQGWLRKRLRVTSNLCADTRQANGNNAAVELTTAPDVVAVSTLVRWPAWTEQLAQHIIAEKTNNKDPS